MTKENKKYKKSEGNRKQTKALMLAWKRFIDTVCYEAEINCFRISVLGTNGVTMFYRVVLKVEHRNSRNERSDELLIRRFETEVHVDDPGPNAPITVSEIIEDHTYHGADKLFSEAG